MIALSIALGYIATLGFVALFLRRREAGASMRADLDRLAARIAGDEEVIKAIVAKENLIGDRVNVIGLKVGMRPAVAAKAE